jgi:hypothetical protein
MKFIKLFDSYENTPSIEDIFKPKINWDLIDNMKDLALEYVDEGLTLRWSIFIKETSDFKSHMSVASNSRRSTRLCNGEFDHSEDYKEFNHWNREGKYDGCAYPEILKKEYSFIYAMNIVEYSNGNETYRTDNKKTVELYNNLEKMYSEEYIILQTLFN